MPSGHQLRLAEHFILSPLQEGCKSLETVSDPRFSSRHWTIWGSPCTLIHSGWRKASNDSAKHFLLPFAHRRGQTRASPSTPVQYPDFHLGSSKVCSVFTTRTAPLQYYWRIRSFASTMTLRSISQTWAVVTNWHSVAPRLVPVVGGNNVSAYNTSTVYFDSTDPVNLSWKVHERWIICNIDTMGRVR
jgi:hypothetical protein